MKRNALIQLKDRGLFMSFSLVTFDFIPYLFVAQDETQMYHLCHCSETRDGFRWVVTQTNLKIVSELLKKKISMRDALSRGATEKYIVEYTSTSGFESVQLQFDQIDEFDLPEENLYLEYPDEDAMQSFGHQLVACMYSKDEAERIEEENEVPTYGLTMSANICQPSRRIASLNSIMLRDDKHRVEKGNATDLSVAA